MNSDHTRTLIEQALENLATALERGQSDALRRYLSVMARFRKYSWQNTLLIAVQNPDASHVAGFHAWLKLGRHVRKGEKGIAILAPIIAKPRPKGASDLAGAQDHVRLEDSDTSLPQERRVCGFRVVHVFDIKQTEGSPLREFAQVSGDPKEATDRLKAFVAGKRIELEYAPSIAPAKGVSSGGRITLLPGMAPAEEFCTLVHELAHEMLHRGERRHETSVTVRETEAEAVAFVVCQAVGLETHTAASDYIQLYRGTKDTLTESLALIQVAALAISTAIGV